jgi:hypothetical protein
MAEKSQKHDYYSRYPDIEDISVEKLDLLGVGTGVENKDKLYWRGKPVKMKSQFSLSFWQGFIALMAALGAILSGITDLLTYLSTL